MLRYLLISIMFAGLCLPSASQTKLPTAKGPDASALLRQVDKKYADATYYRIEVSQETVMKSDLSRQWDKTILSGTLAPGNRYRFEAHSQYGNTLKVSDGKAEVNYNFDFHEYTQQKASGSGPIIKVTQYWQLGMLQAVSLSKTVSELGGPILHPVYLRDETISINGRRIPCYVIKGKVKGENAYITEESTVWIDKGQLLYRKQKLHREGRLISNSPRSYISDQVSVYTITDIAPAAFPDKLFLFAPPVDAVFVPEFSDPNRPRNDSWVGKAAPALALHDVNGHGVSLNDFHGKPVLLDFWVSWCPPCAASLDSLKKLHNEPALAGLVILSIDEDYDLEAATKAFAKRNPAWPDFHDGDGKLLLSFHTDGAMPYYVLINPEGQIVYTKAGTNEQELRAALAKLQNVPGDGSTPKQ